MENITDKEYLLIIDGSSLLSTQFYGNLPREIMFAKTVEEKEKHFGRIMQTSTGIYTNAVYGFMRVLLKILKEQRPSHLAVTWDLTRDTFRRELYPEYKANRSETIEPLKQQFALCQEVLKSMNIAQFMDTRYEADDFSGSLSKKFETKLPVRLLTKDNDYMQLITENTHVWIMHSTSKKTEELYQKYGLNQKKLNVPDRTFPFDSEMLKAEFGIYPKSVVSLKALQGDASDNIKGVPGVGETTATALISHYESVERLYEEIKGLDEKEKKKVSGFWKEELEIKRSPMNFLLKESDSELVGEKAAILSKELASIKTDIELNDLSLDDLMVRINKDLAKKEFERLEFKSLKFEEDDWQAAEGMNPFEASGDGFVISEDVPFSDKEDAERKNQSEYCSESIELGKLDFEQLVMIPVSELKEFEKIIDCAIEEKENKKLGLFSQFSFSFVMDCDTIYGVAAAVSKEKIYYISLLDTISVIDFVNAFNRLKEHGICVACYQLKKMLHYIDGLFLNEDDIAKSCFDIEIAAYLIDSSKGKYPLSDLSEEYLGASLIQWDALLDGVPLSGAIHLYADQIVKAAVCESAVIYHLKELFHNRLEQMGMDSLFYDIEMPLIYTLYEMEKSGIKIDAEALKKYSDQLGKSIAELEKSIYAMTGEEFNINSPKQLGVILFEKLNLPNGKKTKTGYSTSAEVLEKLIDKDPVIEKILEYRQLTKLKSTYADGLANYISEDGRIHGTFNQTVTATGRLSSTEPNLQNIPIRMELGRQIRKVFIPEDGFIFLDADYSQIELRILAHMSGDAKLIAAYNEAQDIHRITASQVFHVPLSEVTDVQRSNAKAVNFGIVYGISSFGLGQGLDISRSEAEEYIDQYFETYPDVKGFLNRLIEDGKEQGYVSTEFGRKRSVKNLTNKNYQARSAEERIAMNSPIQGTAADIIKIAMIEVNKRLKAEHMKSKLILQIHDELLVETLIEEKEIVRKIMTEEMLKAAQLLVSLEIEINEGIDWYEAK